ncbi:MAG TPA: hypothetical protein VM328_00400 [Fimbriimonadaceae bacterium]|jgi:hypothetical protein|nr:hypothetical protein [Fimbriimonadaceae bacterium]
MPAIYVMSEQGTSLVEMTELPYELEDVLQALLQDYPDLLSGDSSKADRHRYLLIGREVGLASEHQGAERWSIDHLFVDEDGVPTIVEVKRSTDTRIRREVVGQMLDYAANAVIYWPVERLRQRFEDRFGDPAQAVAELTAQDMDVDEFWDRVKTNLHAGKVRLIFVADLVPLELQRIVEFLNSQCRSAEVLALEVKRYAGESFQALVSRTVGETAAAAETKSTGPRSEKRQWDEDSFFEALAEKVPDSVVAAGRQLLDWANSRDLRLWWGHGAKEGSFMPMLDVNDLPHWTFAVYTYGAVEIPFIQMAKWGPFANLDLRRELLRRLNQIPGIDIPVERLTKRPSVPLGIVAGATPSFLNVFDWYLDMTRTGGAQDGEPTTA